MSDLPMPVANRLPRPRWLDVRLISGLLLILVSVVVGAKLFAEVDERVEVWAVTRDLGAQATLAKSDLVVRAVRLDDTARRYVSADEKLDGLVLNRAVGRNELLPVAALSDGMSHDQRRVAVEVYRFSASGLNRGSVVDLYAVRESDSADDSARPELVLAGVTVAEDVKTGNGSLGSSGSKAGVTLLVPSTKVPTLIEAMAHATIYLVVAPVAGKVETDAAP
jgi:hypothetical protein